MSEVLNSSFDSLNISGNVSEKVGEIASEDIVRVTEQAQKARQVAQQIAQSKQDGSNFAYFLALLIKQPSLDVLLGDLIQVLFVDQTHHRRPVNSELLVGFFVPFYVREIESLNLGKFYEQFGQWRDLTLVSYIAYIKNLFSHTVYVVPEYQYLQHIDKSLFVNNVIKILQHYELVQAQLNNDQIESLKQSLMKELF